MYLLTEVIVNDDFAPQEPAHFALEITKHFVKALLALCDRLLAASPALKFAGYALDQRYEFFNWPFDLDGVLQAGVLTDLLAQEWVDVGHTVTDQDVIHLVRNLGHATENTDEIRLVLFPQYKDFKVQGRIEYAGTTFETPAISLAWLQEQLEAGA